MKRTTIIEGGWVCVCVGGGGGGGGVGGMSATLAHFGLYHNLGSIRVKNLLGIAIVDFRF